MEWRCSCSTLLELELNHHASRRKEPPTERACESAPGRRTMCFTSTAPAPHCRSASAPGKSSRRPQQHTRRCPATPSPQLKRADSAEPSYNKNLPLSTNHRECGCSPSVGLNNAMTGERRLGRQCDQYLVEDRVYGLSTTVQQRSKEWERILVIGRWF